MTFRDLTFFSLPDWHQKMLHRLMEVDFPGKDIVQSQLSEARYRIMDGGRILEIIPQEDCIQALPGKTVPVQGQVFDANGIIAEVLLFIRKGRVYMLEVLCSKEKETGELPSPEKFEVFTLKG